VRTLKDEDVRTAREVSVGRAEHRLAAYRPTGGPGASEMMRLRCEDCGTPFYSAAARIMVDRGERCSVCGGRLRLEEPDAPRSRIRVAAREKPDPAADR
jgi:DNA-directed RNA polymerase subunit RPC12/RpoP